MLLEEAKQILNDNGYELLDEGKLGRALGIGALALGSLFNSVFANDEFDNRPKIEIEDGLGYKQIKMLGGGKYKIKTKSSLFGTSIEEGTFVDVDSDFPQLINGVEYNYYNGDKSIHFYKNKKLVKCLEYNKNTKKFENITDNENKCPTWINDLKLENKINEGKLSRALGIGALALGSLVGNANAINQDDIDRFEKQTEMEYKNVIKNGDDFIVYKEGSNIVVEQNWSNQRYDKIIIKSNLSFRIDEYHNNVLIEQIYGKIDKITLTQLKKGNTFIDSKFWNKTIKYKNGEATSVTLYKNGHEYKTLCSDGRIIKKLFTFTNIDDETTESKDNCTGEIERYTK